ncbi:MAG TPA: RNA 2',3'-cyclic phosphodiesterase [archaeon]|nr:RNA 2',3'-cyclic phosphodiesterase [archaeon]
MRLFVGIEIPKEIREKIAPELSLKIPRREFKIVEEKNLHITLCFIGEVPEESAPEIKSRLSEIKFASFRARLEGAGSFPGRVLWLGLSDGAKECEELAAKTRHALGVQEERLHAHVTLARNRHAEDEEFARAESPIKKMKFAEEFEVRAFSLLQSRLLQSGPVYEGLAVFPSSTFLSRDSGS